MTKLYPQPRKILRNGAATIVLFSDGSKSVVKLQDGEPDDQYCAVCIAIAKRFVGSNTELKRLTNAVEDPKKPKKPKTGFRKKRTDLLTRTYFPDLEELFHELFERS